jgi:hypothetical protein
MSECSECQELRDESLARFKEYLAAKDELAMTRKGNRCFDEKRDSLKAAEGRLRESHKREHHHQLVHRYNNLEPTAIEGKLQHLRELFYIENEDGVRDAIFELGEVRRGWDRVPDEVVDGLLAILTQEQAFTSHLAGHLLNYFEFETRQLSPSQKKRCAKFVKDFGNRFTDVLAVQVITELRYDDYLK